MKTQFTESPSFPCPAIDVFRRYINNRRIFRKLAIFEGKSTCSSLSDLPSKMASLKPSLQWASTYTEAERVLAVTLSVVRLPISRSCLPSMDPTWVELCVGKPRERNYMGMGMRNGTLTLHTTARWSHAHGSQGWAPSVLLSYHVMCICVCVYFGVCKHGGGGFYSIYLSIYLWLVCYEL